MSLYWSVAHLGASEILQAGVDYLKKQEEEKTHREWIRANYLAFLDALQAEQETLLAYFDYRFAERRESLEEFYKVLHQAVDAGNDHQLDGAIAGILGIIKENPLFEYAEFKRAFADPDTIIEL